MANYCTSSPWCDEDKCKCDEWAIFKEVLANNKYEIYCSRCNQTIAYTNHDFKTGDLMMSKLVVLNDGTNPKSGDIIKCGCQVANIRTIKSRDNSDYKMV